MNLTVHPTSFVEGQFWLPASKSYSIRAFIIASRGGQSQIIHPSNCDDALVALKVAKSFGVDVSVQDKTSFFFQATQKLKYKNKIDVGESGTVLRIVLPLVSLQEKAVTITGQGTLLGRPNKHLNECLRKLGIDIRGSADNESVPIVKKVGQLAGGTMVVDGSLSSQFISALLITAPSLPKDSRIVVSGRRLVSQTYIAMTLAILKKAGIKIQQISVREFFVKGRQQFKGLRRFVVPSDYGLAAFFLAAGSLVQSRLRLQGALKDDLVQADGKILELLKNMGVIFKKTAHAITLQGPFSLKGGTFSLKDCPDLLPIMAVLALFARGKTRFVGVKHARVKESDRIGDLAYELKKVGAVILTSADSMIVHPQPRYKANCELNPHADHRLAMAFAVLGLKVGATIKNIECTHKSYPDFVKDFKSIGAKVLVSP